MTSRRDFLQWGLLTPAAVLLGAAPALAAARPRMPDEGERHQATWMAFGASDAVWGKRLLPAVRDNLATIARTIAAFEPVTMLVREQDEALAARLCGPGVTLQRQALDDIWLRDTGPVFVRQADGSVAGVDFNFNGWGGKQAYLQDAAVAAGVCRQAGVARVSSSLVLEGGAIEVDGEGTAIITASCVLNDNRNPGLGRAACEAELQRVLGVEKVIWLPGIAGRDITDGHTDFYARFCRPGVVLASVEPNPASWDHAVTQRHLAILREARDARGRSLQVLPLPAPRHVRAQYDRRDFAAGYANFHVCNGAVIAPQFGDAAADAYCRDLLREQFPQREVVQLNIDALAAGGGGIHCVTLQQPATEAA